jgi:hypothetical protein
MAQLLLDLNKWVNNLNHYRQPLNTSIISQGCQPIRNINVRIISPFAVTFFSLLNVKMQKKKNKRLTKKCYSLYRLTISNDSKIEISQSVKSEYKPQENLENCVLNNNTIGRFNQ